MIVSQFIRQLIEFLRAEMRKNVIVLNNEGGSSVKCVWIARITSSHWSHLMAHEGRRHARRAAVNEGPRASGSTQNKTQQTQHGIVSHQSGSLSAPSALVCSLLCSQPPLASLKREPCALGKASDTIDGRRQESPEQRALLITNTIFFQPN